MLNTHRYLQSINLPLRLRSILKHKFSAKGSKTSKNSNQEKSKHSLGLFVIHPLVEIFVSLTVRACKDLIFPSIRRLIHENAGGRCRKNRIHRRYIPEAIPKMKTRERGRCYRSSLREINFLEIDRFTG